MLLFFCYDHIMSVRSSMRYKKVTIVCQLFYPELVSTGQSMTELAEEMVRQGAVIDSICGPPTILKSKTKIPKRMVYQGITINRVWGTCFSKLSFLGKLFNQLTFSLSLIWRLCWDSSKTPLLITTNPPFLPFLVVCCYPFHRRKMILKIADLYPDTLVECNVFSDRSIIVKLWSLLNDWVYAKVDHIIVLGRCMEKRVFSNKSSFFKQKVSMVPVWGDDTLIQNALINKTSYFERWGIENKFVCLYAGNMGRFHDLKTFVDVAFRLKDINDIMFVFVGDGYQRKWLEHVIRKCQLTNVLVKDYVSKDDLGALLCSASLGLVSLKLGNEGCSVPSKTFGLLAAGLPVIAVMSTVSEIAMMIDENGLGKSFLPGDIDGVVDEIMRYFNDEELVKACSLNCRQTIQDKYSLKLAAERYLQIVERVSL
ncbi:hypothetical protein DID75_03170 [Candidatus Marinamargulisbacteria bacterium SCGC AG-410-N11]|nr:hypothetical protein DID75_03170 [Candidatus Marinamargulisbacteria bacterium SCGC AG-410-N11]